MTTTTSNTDASAGPTWMQGQAPIALIGLAAIGLILAVNFAARPPGVTTSERVAAAACGECGTVLAVRRSAHSAPVFFVEVQMLDGSLRTVRQLAAGFNVGDVVQVNGNALTLRRTS